MSSWAESIIEINKFLREVGLYDRFQDFLRRRTPYPVIFTGASGAGKTALLRSICNLDTLVDRQHRTDDVEHIKKVFSDKCVTLIDIPGETLRTPKRIEAYKTAMRHRSVGIVNVVSFGYHEGRAPQSDVIVENRVREDFLSERRQQEIDLLDEWGTLLCGNGGVVSWTLTVVTKGDLWWAKAEDQPVIDFYTNREYGNRISTYNVPHTVFPYSSSNSLFYGVIPMSGFYPDSLRAQHKQALMTALLERLLRYAS